MSDYEDADGTEGECHHPNGANEPFVGPQTEMNFNSLGPSTNQLRWITANQQRRSMQKQQQSRQQCMASNNFRKSGNRNRQQRRTMTTINGIGEVKSTMLPQHSTIRSQSKHLSMPSTFISTQSEPCQSSSFCPSSPSSSSSSFAFRNLLPIRLFKMIGTRLFPSKNAKCFPQIPASPRQRQRIFSPGILDGKFGRALPFFFLLILALISMQQHFRVEQLESRLVQIEQEQQNQQQRFEFESNEREEGEDKKPPELHELDRSLRPLLLKLGSKFNTGRLWTDNPIPDYKNGFYVAFDLELMGNLLPIDSADSKIQNSEQYWQPVLKAQLDRFERNAPIRFVELQKNNKILNASENGLQRNKEENNVFLDGKELQEGSLEIQEILLKALGVNAGEGLRVEYDRRDKFMPPLRRAFAQLNGAYGAENYAFQGQPSKLIRNQRIIDKPEVQFWMGPEYANFLTRKYEIPVVYDNSFKITKKNKKLFDEVYANFAKKSVIQFVVHEEAPKEKSYVRIYHDDNDDSSNAAVGHPTKRDSSYQGEKMEFGKNLMTSRHALYHEFMHVAGMEHEHQRADIEQFLKIDHEKGQKMLQMSKGEYAINYMPDATYLPINEYNPRSIMHYDMNWEFFEPNSEKAKQQKNQQLPTEPDQMDWENLNHFYGVGKGRTQFKVEIDENGQQKIVNDIDGMRRL